jgi:hypothetical protein
MALANAQKQKRWRDKRNALARLADDHFDLTRRVLKSWPKKRASKSPPLCHISIVAPKVPGR